MAQKPNARIAVELTATDAYSAAMAKFRAELEMVEKPLRKLRGAADVSDPKSAFSSLAPGFAAATGHASRLRASVAGLAPGFGALAGIGTVAGIGAATVSFAEMGIGLENTAKMAGMTASGLNSMRGAARLAGVSVGAVDNSMTGLNATLNAAAFGKPEGAAAANWFRKLGIDFGNAQKGAAPLEQVLHQLIPSLTQLYRTNPQAASNFAAQFGISPELLPLLAKGNDEMERRRKVASDLSAMTPEMVAAAERYTEAQGRITIGAEGLRNVLVTGLEPALTPLLTKFSTWVVATDQIGRSMKAVRTELEFFEAAMDKIKAAGHAVGADLIPPMITGAPLPAGPAKDLHDSTNRVLGLDQGQAAAPPMSAWDSFMSRMRNMRLFSPSNMMSPAPNSWSGHGAPGPAAPVPMDGNTQVSGGTALSPTGFANQYGNVADWIGKQLGNSRRLTLAQMSLESGSGRGVSGKNNPFNITAGPGEDATEAFDKITGHSYRFKNFPNLESAAAAYVEKTRRQWSGAQGSGDDPRRLVDGLRVGEQGGYAESVGPDVASKKAAYEAGLRSRMNQLPPDPAPASTAVAPTAPALPPPAASPSTVRIDITHSNVPDNVNMSAAVLGDQAELGRIRIARAMPAGG